MKKKSKRTSEFIKMDSEDLDMLIKSLEEVWHDRVPETKGRTGDTSVLRIFEGDGMLSYQIGTLHTGWAGFKYFLEANPLNYFFTEIYYNGTLLNKEQKKQFWDQTTSWIEEEKQEEE